MQFIGRTKKQLRQRIGAFLLLPFLLVSALPKGVMPASTGDGWFTVTICTTDGLRTVVFDETGQEVPTDQNEDTSTSNHCVFSFFGSDIVAPDIASGREFGVPAILPWPVSTAQQIRRKITSRLGARAPPFLA